MKNIDSDLIRGNIDTIILTTMLEGDKYGLDIIKEVEIRSNGTYELKQPTLYSCLKRLENQELISSYWLDSDIGGKRHYYKLTEKGKESLLQKQEEWAKSKFIIDNLLSNHNYDEYRLVKKTDYDKIIEGKQFEYTPENSPAQSVLEENKVEPETETQDDEISKIDLDKPLTTFDELEDLETLEDEPESDDENEESEDEEPVQETRIDYHDDSDDAEADYPNQKRFKIPSIYDKINIDKNELESDEETDEDDEYASSIYSESEEENDEDADSDYDEDEQTNYLDEIQDEADNEDFSFESDTDEYMLGNETSDDAEDEDDRVYVSGYSAYEEPEDDDLDIKVNPVADQTQNELNILSRLRMQDDEEINEYVGDKNSYINHLNQHDEIENLKRDDLNVVQEDLLSAGYLSQSEVDEKIDEFSSAIEELNKFSSEVDDEDGDIENYSNDTEIETEIEDELINSSNSHEESENVIDFKEDKKEIAENFDDYLNELNELKETENHGFFNSLDSAEYAPSKHSEFENLKTFDSLEDFDENDSSDAAFEKQFEDYNNQYGYNNSETDSSYLDGNYTKSVQETEVEETNNFSSFDDIISRSASDYTNDTTRFMSSEEFQSFTPRYTENNYKQKLNNLSAYSKVNTEETTVETKEPSEEIMNKVKDIQTLRAEFEDEGICVKEYKKSNGHDDVDRTYLLVNKINLIKSLILLFGYVFVLSAVYIIMNNTSAQTIHNFSFKYFLYGFIPFGIYAIYHTVMFVINPYKKVPAKYAPRIMIFISVIITIQLLLITYCVNLQLGFYSFSQNYYNHLIWVIPTIISFAPIISNLIYMALYYSKNFNV